MKVSFPFTRFAPLTRSVPLTLVMAPTLLFAFSTLSVAAPVIENLRTTDDGKVQITGSGFGAGPNVVLHESFNNTQTGDEDSINLSPEVGQWIHVGGTGSLTSGKEGEDSQALIVKDTAADTQASMVFGLPDEQGEHGLQHFQEVFFSFDLKDLGAYPGANKGRNGLSPNSSSKDAWMMFGQRGDNTQYSKQTRGEKAGHDLYIPGWTGGDFVVAGNETRMNPSFAQTALRDDWAFGDWVTMMFHAKLNPDDPYGDAQGFFAFVNNNALVINHRDGLLMSDQSSDGVPPYWDRIKFNGWLRQGAEDIKRAYDNIYVAVGDNANARVVVTDSPALKQSTRLTHLVPNEWEDGRITLQLPDSVEGQNQYLHVINSANEISGAQHFCLNCPTAPASFEVK